MKTPDNTVMMDETEFTKLLELFQPLIKLNHQFLKESRKLFRTAVFKALPSSVSHQLIRKTLNLSVPAKNSKLKFEIVSNLEDLKNALRLLQNSFEAEGYAKKTTSGLRLTPYHLLPETIVLVAKEHGQIIATLSVVVHTDFGLPLESSVNLKNFMKTKERTVEISALAVDTKAAGQRGEVLYNLMKYLYHCNVELLDTKTQVIGVNPKMVSLYKAILLFKNIPYTKVGSYKFANGAPVVPMYFNLQTAKTEYGKVYGKKSARLNLLDFFLLKPSAHFQIPAKDQLLRLLPQNRSEDLQEILKWEPTLIKTMSPEQKKSLAKLYATNPKCLAVLKQSGLYA